MTPALLRRTLLDYDPKRDEPLEDCFIARADEGWMPEHPWGGAPITLHLTRYAMIHTPDQDPADWPEPGIDG